MKAILQRITFLLAMEDNQKEFHKLKTLDEDDSQQLDDHQQDAFRKLSEWNMVKLKIIEQKKQQAYQFQKMIKTAVVQKREEADQQRKWYKERFMKDREFVVRRRYRNPTPTSEEEAAKLRVFKEDNMLYHQYTK